MKKSLAIIVTMVLLVSMLTLSVMGQAQGQFVGSKDSDVYHYPSCSYVSNIKPENLIWFVDAKDAVNRGYHPCSRCNPPLPESNNPSPSPTTSPTVSPKPTISPTPNATPTTSPSPTASPTPSPSPTALTINPTPTSSPIANPASAPSPTASPSPSSTIPELNTTIVILALIMISSAALIANKKLEHQSRRLAKAD